MLGAEQGFSLRGPLSRTGISVRRTAVRCRCSLLASPCGPHRPSPDSDAHKSPSGSQQSCAGSDLRWSEPRSLTGRMGQQGLVTNFIGNKDQAPTMMLWTEAATGWFCSGLVEAHSRATAGW